MDRGPVPAPTAESAAFWRAAAAGRLSLPHCARCDRHLYPPAPRCPQCLSDDLAWTALAPDATLAEWTIVHLAGPAGLPPPFVVARATLDAAPEVAIVANLDPAVVPRAGMPLAIAFDAIDDEIGLPMLKARA